MQHERFESRQLLHRDRENHFVNHPVFEHLFDHGDGKNLITSEPVIQLRSAAIRIHEANQPESHAATLFDESRHLMGARSTTDKQEIMVATKAPPHPGNAVV